MAVATTSVNRSLDNVKAGVLYKRSRLGLFWKKRWVHASNGEISYSTDPVAPKIKNTISLDFATIQAKPSSRSRYRFEITTAVGQKYEFAAETPREVNEWIRFLRQQLLHKSKSQIKNSEGETDSPGLMSNIGPEAPSPGSPIVSTLDQQHFSTIASPGNHMDPNTGDVAWNETYQSIIEQNESTFDAAVSKAQSLNQLIFDFVSASIRITRTIVEEYTLPAHLKTIQPLDRNDISPEEETFMLEGIVFQYMQEPNGSEAQDELRRKTCTHDVHGIQAYANSSVKRLHTYLCCIVDCFGFRLFCLALVPIYDDSHICFGRIKGQYHIDTSANLMLEQAAAELGLATHLVPLQDTESESSNPEIISVHSSSSLMVHKGEDQRMYVTNLTRSFPMEHKFGTQDESLSMKQLRPEFLKLYGKKLSPDAFIISSTPDSRECDENLDKAIHHLKSHFIQEFVKELDLLQVLPIDSTHFTTLLHSRGINIRHLGLIAESTRLPHVREMAISEMIARCCKQLLNQKMRKRSRGLNLLRREGYCEDNSEDCQANEKLLSAAKAHIKSLRETVAEYFSIFLSTSDKFADFWKNTLADRLQQKFTFKLAYEEGMLLHRPLLLASLQHHCGVWLSDGGASCNFEHSFPVCSNDISCIEPRCKWPVISNSKCNMFPYMAEKYMEDGAYDMATQALRLKLDVILCDKPEMSGSASVSTANPSPIISTLPPPPPPPHLTGKVQSINSQESVYSPSSIRAQMNPATQLPCVASDIHSTLNDLCETYICNDDIINARLCAKRALELSRGPDARTSATYAHLVNIYQTMGQSAKADQCLNVALSILKRMYGSHHPLLVRLLDDVGNRYIELGLHSPAETSLLQALERALVSLGKTHPATAELYSSLGKLYQLENNLDKAKEALEKACLIYEGVYGAACVEVARSCSYLSEIMSQKGDPQMAKYYQERTLKTRMQLDETNTAYFIE